MNQFHRPMWPGEPVRQPYSYSFLSPHRLFKIPAHCAASRPVFSIEACAAPCKDLSVQQHTVLPGRVCSTAPTATPGAEFLDEIQTKAVWVFLLVIHSHLYSFALDFYFFKLTQPLTVFCKGERRKTWKKTILPSLWVKKSIQNPQVWELPRLCPKISMKLYLHEFGFRTWLFYCSLYCP